MLFNCYVKGNGRLIKIGRVTYFTVSLCVEDHCVMHKWKKMQKNNADFFKQ